VEENLINILVCPKCRGELIPGVHELRCTNCRKQYPVKDNVPLFYVGDLNNKEVGKEFEYWNEKDNTPGNLYENITDEYLRRMVELFNLADCTRGLELGCGDGPFARRLENRNMTIYGLDISFPLLKITKNMQPVQGSALELPFKNNFFDWIIYAFALHHMVNLNQALQEAIRVLNAGGRIIIVDPNYYHPIRYLTRKPDTFFRKHVFTYLSPEERWIPLHRLKKVLQENGVDVKIVQMITPDFQSRTMVGKLQKTISTLLNFKPFDRVMHSYYMVIGQKIL
jgi:ubiquinone/menaquinone biosynthesis C-methylase UbiE/uncharacterized protein YbaR (Trm112 family)